jgi:hypothetical protein
MAHQTGTLSEGARRVWRHQRVLWWLFAVNLALAAFGTQPVDRAIGRVADHSLYAQRLYQGFDLSAFSELAANPEVALWSNVSSSLLFAVVFLGVALFLTGGILETYRADRKLATGEFFFACGTFFWRWVRLLVLLLVAIVPIAMLGSVITGWAAVLSDAAPQEKLGFWVEVAGLLLVTVLMMAVRLWFDMAQVRVVAEEERSVVRALVRAFRLTRDHFGSLFWMYIRISFLAWLGLAAALFLWIRVPAQRLGFSFFVLEMALLWWMGTRLWQRASETVWYERHSAVPQMMTPLPAPETFLSSVTAASPESGM